MAKCEGCGAEVAETKEVEKMGKKMNVCTTCAGM